MRVWELKQMLEEMPDDAEVRLAHQPSYPFQYNIDNVAFVAARDPGGYPEAGHFEDEDDYQDALEEWEDRQDAPEEDTVYIVEGGQVRSAPYLPSAAQAVIGW